MSVHISREESPELSAMLQSMLWVVFLSLQTDSATKETAAALW